MDAHQYFFENGCPAKRKYDALRDFYFQGHRAEDVANRYEYQLATFYSLARDFRNHLKSNDGDSFFFKQGLPGRKPIEKTSEINELIIQLRKQNYSTEDIVTMANSKDFTISYGYVYQLLSKEGFTRLTRRSKEFKSRQAVDKIEAPIACSLSLKSAPLMSLKSAPPTIVFYRLCRSSNHENHDRKTANHSGVFPTRKIGDELNERNKWKQWEVAPGQDEEPYDGRLSRTVL